MDVELNRDLYDLALALLDKALVEQNEDERTALLRQASVLFRECLTGQEAKEPRGNLAAGKRTS